jgi:hypothetical protein
MHRRFGACLFTGSSVVDADPDPACLFGADLDSASHFDANAECRYGTAPDSTFHFDAGPHPFDAGPDPACHFDADADPDPTLHF